MKPEAALAGVVAEEFLLARTDSAAVAITGLMAYPTGFEFVLTALLRYWVWPLPPPGPVAFVCEWPAFGIPESRAELHARLILDAAARAVELWPEDGDPARG